MNRNSDHEARGPAQNVNQYWRDRSGKVSHQLEDTKMPEVERIAQYRYPAHERRVQNTFGSQKMRRIDRGKHQRNKRQILQGEPQGLTKKLVWKEFGGEQQQCCAYRCGRTRGQTDEADALRLTNGNCRHAA